MALGIRGSNPIWAEFDLSGKIFDDTYYLYVLQNQIPYIPATVYHDPDLQIPWDNPIQFLGNGTLPIDIFFVPGVVYRLEFRQHVGLGSPSQQDPLIYLVENYVAASGGSGPIDSVAFASSNQVTNPQFALVDFQSPYVFSGTDPAPIQVAPGWFLELAGTGSVTFNQVPLNDDNINPSNAPYALRLTLSGWTSETVFLRQRFDQNGMLWANKVVSSTLTARLEGLPQNVFATLVDSNGTTLGTVLNSSTITGEWSESLGHASLLTTTNPDLPPAAYIDYKLSIPSNIDIYLTSIQLVVQDTEIEPNFEQDSINRQIDHTYNTAYPIIPVGTVIDFGGFSTPDHYFICDGTTKSRNNFNLLFRAITKVETVTLTMSSPTFTVASSADYYIGMKLEGVGIDPGTTISNIVSNTITMSSNATAAGATPVRFFAYGNGDGSTTFTLPDLRDYVVAGVGGSLFGTANNGVGKKGGAASTTEVVNHVHGPGTGLSTYIGSGNSGSGPFSGNAGTAFSNAGVSGGVVGGLSAMSLVQQTALMKKCIRYE